MRIAIVTSGTRGDVQPYIALGKGLKASGHEIKIVTHDLYKAFVEGYGIVHAPLRGNPLEFLESDSGTHFMKSGRNILVFIREWKKFIEPLLATMLCDVLEACRDVDVIFYSQFCFLAADVAEKLKIPALLLNLQPFSRTREFPTFPLYSGWRLGGAFNYLSHALAEQGIWQTLRPVHNQLRQSHLGLPKLGFWGPFAARNKSPEPIFYGYSPLILPKPQDWPGCYHVTGFWFLDAQPDWRCPAELNNFLEAGSPPIYIGFGSMKNQNVEQTTELILKSLHQTGQRAILLTGWGGLKNLNLSENVFVVDSVPHDWLFPKTSLIIHHGGAGTTAAATRAGKPSIVIPFFGDQHFWGTRLFELGTAARPIPRAKLTSELLTQSIQSVTNDPGISSRAGQLGRELRRENGVETAVAAFQSWVKS